jgi:hypothetical protein
MYCEYIVVGVIKDSPLSGRANGNATPMVAGVSRFHPGPINYPSMKQCQNNSFIYNMLHIKHTDISSVYQLPVN